MTEYAITVTIDDEAEHADALGLLFPAGLDTVHQTALSVAGPPGWPVTRLNEAHTGLFALFAARPKRHRGTPVIAYRFADAPGQTDDTPHRSLWPSRWSRPAPELAEEIRRLVAGMDETAAIRAIIDHTAALFSYGHEDTPFNAGTDAVPALSCGLTRGSCIDINTYVLAAAHAAGIAAQYFAGYFFAEERGGETSGMHCWVATWAKGGRAEWDIAHCKRMGHETVAPGYNPKPGRRFALTIGRGLTYDVPGLTAPLVFDHLAAPVWIEPDGSAVKARITAHVAPFP